jgi:Domain of unknown function (DUF4412)
MKPLFVAALFLVSLVAANARSFEGVVHYTITTGKHASSLRYAIKDDRMRMEFGEGDRQSIGLFNGETGETNILMPAQKMYMVIGQVGQATASSPDASLEETGRSEEIAGYLCKEYVVNDPKRKETYEIWATIKLGRYISFSDLQQSHGRTPEWVQALTDQGLFPLRTITKNRKGRVVSTMEATQVEPKELDAADFEIPADYKKFEMPSLGGLLKGLGN